MNSGYETFKCIIRESNYDNTYKMAWAKAIVEYSTELDLNTDIIAISLEMMARKFLKYYWNQTIFFNLRQGSNPLKPPVVLTITQELIDKYFIFKNSNLPILFERAEVELEKNLESDYEEAIQKIAKVLKADVSWRFTFLDRKFHDEVYEYEKFTKEFYIKTSLMSKLKENDKDLYDLINYRWALILETFNSSPRINKKVKIMDERNIKRNSLNKFKEYLDYENNEHICFHCNKPINNDELSIDHVIPWSYMYSDDIWNLVYVCRSCNSSKSNKIPSEKDIIKLKERNKLLEKILKENKIENKIFDELVLANEKDYVNNFWIGSKN